VLLVGRVTTIKLAYWAAVTAVEVALPWALARPLSERLPLSYLALAILTVAALLWAVLAARALDRRAGGLQRSIPTIATTFAAASVVASPASLPLLLIERQRSIEGCVAPQICHWEAIWLWVLAFAVGTILIPAVLAAALPRRAIEPTGPAAPPLPRYR
jgi:hypothetical protein